MDLLTVLCLITIIFFLILIHYRFHSILRSKHRHASNDYVLELHSSTKCQCKYCQGTYKPIKRLGYGGYGISYLCKNIYTDVLFVLKSIPVQSINDANEALNEVYFLQRLHHPNVVHYEEFFLHYDHRKHQSDLFKVIIIMEYCEKGDLYSLITSTSHSCPYTHDQLFHFIVQLCHALAYIHKYDIVHRDIKPDNIFITQKESIRLGDFGLARVINPSMLKHIQTLSITGTQLYRAPEMDRRHIYDKMSDVWSLGIVILEIIRWKCYDITSDDKYYYTQQWIDQEIHSLQSPSPFLSFYKDLLCEMLVVDPQRRSSMQSIFLKPSLQPYLSSYSSLSPHDGDSFMSSVNGYPYSTLPTIEEGRDS